MDPLLILSLVGVYFVVLIALSVITSRKADNDSFFLGNRRSPWVVVAIGMVGASLSGVTFVSVPGYVTSVGFTYMQMVAGFFVGYLVIAFVLLPLYYRLNLTSIYSYLDGRFGVSSYKSGALLFIASKLVGAAARLYLMAVVLQIALFDDLGVSFATTVAVLIGLIYLYTFRGGIKTIIWTDALQTLLFLVAVGVTIYHIGNEMNLGVSGLISAIGDSGLFKIFEFENWHSSQHFVKQFFSGIFITIVMTGLDQDMMQKNLSCRNLRESRKNVLSYGFAFVPVNLLFLSLGALLVVFMQFKGIPMPARADDIFPVVATGGYLPLSVGVLFFLGLLAAALSSADSALTSLTTSFSVDILKVNQLTPQAGKRVRMFVHLCFAIITGFVIIVFRMAGQDSIIDTVYTLAGYTYGPLLGLFAFGLYTRRRVRDKVVPLIAVLTPLITGVIDYNAIDWFGFALGFEKLMLNGAMAFGLLWIFSHKES
ncbi:sodium:solute symporter [Marinilabilia salmonicolor]|jgi:Na+/proline symporter|uniref:Na+/proline symporter n=1 Tax=Marinilabilia salmonicolor TaxID=989 RepID=A0A2T0XNR7_9BACT|nr:sodium:solute symporter [Marinilabilia salmonicolor]PRZ00522.1 Na+/proline symporter [Marinilabilia salmonicolor]RCW32732.1 Na+/proline symporter [Marinilabilia salmonicolor]